MPYVVDTHALVWFLEGDARLSAPARDALSDKTVDLVIPSIVLAEVFYLHSKHRIIVDLPQVLARLDETANCAIMPLDEAVAMHLPTGINIHDAIIVATALLLREAYGDAVSVVTKDSEIMASGLVDVIW